MKLFYNTFVTRSDSLNLYQKENNPKEFYKYVAENILKLKFEDHMENDIKIDYFTNIYRFCLSKNFTIEQRSTLLSMGVYLYRESIEKKIPSFESYDLLVDILKYHILQRPPYSIKMFTEENRIEILKFFRMTFYKHYSLYEIAGTKFTDYTVITSQALSLQLPPLSNLNDGEIIQYPENMEILKFLYFKNNANDTQRDPKDGMTIASDHDIILESPIQPEMLKKVEENIPLEPIKKTEEELKLEQDLSKTFKDFYDQFDKKLKVKDERINKLLAPLMPKHSKK